MSQLYARSILVLALLFGLLFAVGAGILYYYNVPVGFAVAFAVGIVLLQYLISPFLIDLIFKIRWTVPEEISPQFAGFLRDLCWKRGIPVPRFGIIDDGNPNAFTYGHMPGDARLVVTRGIQQMLTEEEFSAVVAHEVGHIRHYDFIVMTLASVVPLVLYVLYVWTRSGRRGGSYAAVVALGAYVAYVVSQYIVLLLSRIREYFADEHAAYSVSSAHSIGTALIKIAYGLARIPQDQLQQDQAKKKQIAVNPSRLMGSLGICSFSSATPMALYSTTATGHFSFDKMARAMQWDLWNPWARIFELQSTHPLIARRVLAASRIAYRRRQTPQLDMPRPPKESYWREFVMDLIFVAVPYLGLAVGGAGLLSGAYTLHTGRAEAMLGAQQIAWLGPLALGILLFGIGWMLRLAYSYSNQFRRAKVEDLVGEVAVSHVRCIPVQVEGQVIGRGVPGLFWSKDLVVQDDTGFITLVYKQPLSILETLFGLFRADRFVGRKGVFRGWYRRGPAPYLELREAVFEDGDRANCYYYAFAWIGAILAALAGGLILLLVSA